MQMFCPAVMPSTQLGECSDRGETLLSQVGPCSVIAEALMGGGKVLAAAGTRGKPFVFIQSKLQSEKTAVHHPPNFLQYYSVLF